MKFMNKQYEGNEAIKNLFILLFKTNYLNFAYQIGYS